MKAYIFFLSTETNKMCRVGRASHRNGWSSSVVLYVTSECIDLLFFFSSDRD